jgi:23S rRNA pseudouridine955/2504/2580 synthase
MGNDQKMGVQYIKITEEQADRRLDHVLFSFLPSFPKDHIFKLLRTGQIRVNGKRAKPFYRVLVRDRIRIPPIQVIRQLKTSVLYEDDAIMVINKPPGLAVHGGSGLTIGLINALRYIRSDLLFLELVHRLDRSTSGCLILAKKHDVLRELHQLIQAGKITKKYYALTQGHWPKKFNRVETLLKKQAPRGGERLIQVDISGKASVTLFRVIKEFSTCSLVEVNLLSGRTHQLRVHAQYMGHPIAGDEKYGDKSFNRFMQKKGLNRLFLHAFLVKFHIKNYSQSLEIKAPMDAKLIRILDVLSVI